jgi:hypothetical protein
MRSTPRGLFSEIDGDDEMERDGDGGADTDRAGDADAAGRIQNTECWTVESDGLLVPPSQTHSLHSLRQNHRAQALGVLACTVPRGPRDCNRHKLSM